jgi:hypothetical protein
MAHDHRMTLVESDIVDQAEPERLIEGNRAGLISHANTDMVDRFDI